MSQEVVSNSKIRELETDTENSTDLRIKGDEKKKQGSKEDDEEQTEKEEKKENSKGSQLVPYNSHDSFPNFKLTMGFGWKPNRNFGIEIIGGSHQKANYPPNQMQLYKNLHYIAQERQSDILFMFSEKNDNNVALMQSNFQKCYERLEAEFGVNGPQKIISLDFGLSNDLTVVVIFNKKNCFLSAKINECLFWEKIDERIINCTISTHPKVTNVEKIFYFWCKPKRTSFSTLVLSKSHLNDFTDNVLSNILLNCISDFGRELKPGKKNLKKDQKSFLRYNCLLLVKLLLIVSNLSGKTSSFCSDSLSDKTKEIFCRLGKIIHECVLKDHTLLEDNLCTISYLRARIKICPENILEYLCAFRLEYLIKTEREAFFKAVSELKHIRNNIIFALSARMVYPKDEETWDPSLFMCYCSVYGKDELPSWLQRKAPHFKVINSKISPDGQIHIMPNFKSQQEKKLFELMIINGHFKKLCFKETMKMSEGMCLLQESIPAIENLPVFHLTTFTSGFCKSFLKDLSLSELIISFSILEDNDTEAIAKAVQSKLTSLTLIDCELEGCWDDFFRQILGKDSKLAKLNVACEGFSDSEIESISEILGKSESLRNLIISCDEIQSMNLLKFFQDGKKKWESVELTNFILFIPEKKKLEDFIFTVCSLALFGKSESLQKSAKALSLCSIESLICHGCFLQEMTKFSEWQSFHTIRELKIIDTDLKVITSLIRNFVKLDKFRWGITEGANTEREIARQWARFFFKMKRLSQISSDSTLFRLLGFSEDYVEPSDFIMIIKQIVHVLVVRLNDDNKDIIEILEISISQEWTRENLKEFLKTVKDLVLLLQNKTIRQLKVDLIGYNYWKKPIQIKDVQAVFPLNQFQTEFKQKEGLICDTIEIIINAVQ